MKPKEIQNRLESNLGPTRATNCPGRIEKESPFNTCPQDARVQCEVLTQMDMHTRINYKKANNSRPRRQVWMDMWTWHFQTQCRWWALVLVLAKVTQLRVLETAPQPFFASLSSLTGDFETQVQPVFWGINFASSFWVSRKQKKNSTRTVCCSCWPKVWLKAIMVFF